MIKRYFPESLYFSSQHKQRILFAAISKTFQSQDLSSKLDINDTIFYSLTWFSPFNWNCSSWWFYCIRVESHYATRRAQQTQTLWTQVRYLITLSDSPAGCCWSALCWWVEGLERGASCCVLVIIAFNEMNKQKSLLLCFVHTQAHIHSRRNRRELVWHGFFELELGGFGMKCRAAETFPWWVFLTMSTVSTDVFLGVLLRLIYSILNRY